MININLYSREGLHVVNLVYNSHLYTLQSTSLTLLDDQRLQDCFVSITFSHHFESFTCTSNNLYTRPWDFPVKGWGNQQRWKETPKSKNLWFLESTAPPNIQCSIFPECVYYPTDVVKDVYEYIFIYYQTYFSWYLFLNSQLTWILTNQGRALFMCFEDIQQCCR